MWSTISVLLLFCSSGYGILKYNEIHKLQEWDVIIFVQHWLPTNLRECMEYTNECYMPSRPDSWTVHGIWASRIQGDWPYFCNETCPLNLEDITSIQHELDEAWSDILKSTPDFWTLEWSRHGTCFVDQPSFNSPLKYFQQGLNWHKKYNISSILAKAEIVPSDTKTYKSEDFVKAVESSIGKTPQLQCSWHDNKQYISEIRLCFTKSIELTDCKFSEQSFLHISKRRIQSASGGRSHDGTGVQHIEIQDVVHCNPALDVVYSN